jgi:hypothetical protein
VVPTQFKVAETEIWLLDGTAFVMQASSHAASAFPPMVWAHRENFVLEVNSGRRPTFFARLTAAEPNEKKGDVFDNGGNEFPYLFLKLPFSVGVTGHLPLFHHSLLEKLSYNTSFIFSNKGR